MAGLINDFFSRPLFCVCLDNETRLDLLKAFLTRLKAFPAASSRCVCMCVCVGACVCVCICMCMCVCLCVCVYICECVCAHTHAHVRECEGARVYFCVFVSWCA